MTEPALQLSPARRLKTSHLFIVIFAIVGFVILALWPRHVANGGLSTANDVDALREQVAALEEKVATLEIRVDDLGTRVTSTSAAPALTVSESAKTNSPDVVRLQSDVVALSAALTALQAEVKQTGKDTEQNQHAAQALYAAAIAFLQLRDAVNSGHGFIEELAAMRVTTKGDDAFQEPLAKLEPYASNGVPSVPVLYTQFQTLAVAAGQAISESGAQTWWQRILATLRGLIVIRSTNDVLTPNDPLGEIESDLAQGAISTALATMNNLPAAAEETMKNWRVEAEARQTADQSLHLMAQLLVSAALPPPSLPQGNQGTP
jgi:hypothetical protein